MLAGWFLSFRVLCVLSRLLLVRWYLPPFRVRCFTFSFFCVRARAIVPCVRALCRVRLSHELFPLPNLVPFLSVSCARKRFSDPLTFFSQLFLPRWRFSSLQTNVLWWYLCASGSKRFDRFADLGYYSNAPSLLFSSLSSPSPELASFRPCPSTRRSRRSRGFLDVVSLSPLRRCLILLIFHFIAPSIIS